MRLNLELKLKTVTLKLRELNVSCILGHRLA